MRENKIIIGIPSSAHKGNKWYERGDVNITDADKVLNRMKGAKAISYFKVVYRARGGSSTVTQFWKTMDNGYMVCVDTSICRINIVLGFPSVRMFQGCTKREYQTAFNKVLKVLS